MNKKPWFVAALLIGLIASATCLWPAAANPPASAVTVQDLKIDSAAFPELHHVEVQAEVIDSEPGNANAPGMILMLRKQGIRSSANYKIWLRAEPHPIIIKARINVLVDAQHAVTALAKWYGPETRALTSPLTLGDDSFNLQDRLVVMRIDRVLIELTVKGQPERLKALATAYERFTLTQLDK